MNINAILRADPRPCRYGAPMGSRNVCDQVEGLHLQRVRFVDYCYGPDGTYWGGGTPMYCAFSSDGAQDTRIYVRANSRASAQVAILAEWPDVTFKRG